MQQIALWGGVECTLNRVGDRYFDQLTRSGHCARLDDFERIARLGIRVLRFPALWERVAPEHPERFDWSWIDEALERVRATGMKPIVGFVHHGSGPRYTGLLDPAFPELLAHYAHSFAERYPWVEAYTPVNEPLTTARFSGLYGLWHPHTRDAASFLAVLANECRGTVEAMAAVRRVNPRAQLVQTEDLGLVMSTPRLAYQAEFENHRRWLAIDLLAGRVDASHPLARRLLAQGMSERALDWFAANPCLPDLLGINHYITSNRFLDERLERYPQWTHGGNRRERYADVEAVRVSDVPFVPPCELLFAAWERYRVPLAITEAHLGCTRDEQMRWLIELWRSANAARDRGADVRAVTAWSLLGAYDWDSLVTCERGHYEPGAFDVRGAEPRRTAVAGVIEALAAGKEPCHPALAAPGWWRRQTRVLYGADGRHCGDPGMIQSAAPAGARRELLITGARGTLGRAFARLCEQRGLAYRLLDRQALDIADPTSVRAALASVRPWAVINAAGYCRVDEAEREPEACYRENAVGPALLAAACAEDKLPLVTFSSDLVFDGRARSPYRESDAVSPLSVYGRSKADAERDVLQAHAGALLVRTSAFFGPWDDYNFVTSTLRALARGEVVRAADDLTVSPTYVPDLINASLDLLIDGATGIWHLANGGATSWAELAVRAAELRGYEAARVAPVPAAQLGLTAPRPSYSALASERGAGIMPALETALERYAAECQVA